MENNILNKLLPPGRLPPALSSGELLRTIYGTTWHVQKIKLSGDILKANFKAYKKSNKDNISQNRKHMCLKSNPICLPKKKVILMQTRHSNIIRMTNINLPMKIFIGPRCPWELF